jgi:hypothetical protein
MHTCVCLLFAPRCALQNGASGEGAFLARQRALHFCAFGGAKFSPARANRLQSGGGEV